MAGKNTMNAQERAKRAALERAKRAADAATQAIENRDKLIRAAIAAGATVRDVEDATGVPKSTAQRIATRSDDEATS